MQPNEQADAANIEDTAASPEVVAQHIPSAADETDQQSDMGADETAGEGSAEGEGAIPDMRSMISWAAMQLTPTELAQVLLPVFDARARVALGLLGDPRTGQAEENLPDARLAIDAVQFFLSRVEGQFAESDRRELQRRLADLRMNFVSRQSKSE